MVALRFGPWVVQGVLGRGGMGELYAARHEQSGVEAAVKVMRAELVDGDAVQRFEREVRALFSVRHPDVVAPLDAGRGGDGRPWLAMERIAGESLQALVQRRGPLAALDAARLIERVARALDHVHAQGVVHRDIKPENILLGPDGAPRIVDFGLARFLLREGSLTASSELLGTPAYMAPEQADGRARQAGPTADVYSLGATLFFLLCGRPPFQGASAISVFEQVLTATPPAPSSLVPGSPRGLDAVVLRCLEKDPAGRYTTAGELADALRALERPTRARRRRRSRAWPALVGAAVLIATAIAVALSVGGEAEPPASVPAPAPATAPEPPPAPVPPAPVPPAPIPTTTPTTTAPATETELDPLEALARMRARLATDASDVDACVAVAWLARLTERPGRAWVTRALERAAARAPRRADVLVELTWALRHEGRLDEALDVAARAAALDPVDPTPHALASRILTELGDSREAIRRAEHALSIDPSHELARCHLAAVVAEVEGERALRLLDACVADERAGSFPWTLRAVTLMGLGRSDEALRDLDRAVELDPYGTLALGNRLGLSVTLQRWSEARADAETILARDPWSPGRFMARAMTRRLDLPGAVADLERELARPGAASDPDMLPRAAAMRGELMAGLRAQASGAVALRTLSAELERAGARRAALEVWRDVVGEEPATPEDAARHVTLGLACGEVAEAGRVAKGAVASWPSSARVWAALGQAERAAGRRVEALRAAEQALALGPDEPQALELRGRIEFDGAHRVTGPWLRQAVDLDAGAHEARAILALDQGRRGELDAALARLHELTSEAPALALAPHFVAQLLMHRDDWAGVAAAETEALNRDPRIADAWWFRAEARLRLGDLDAGVADLTCWLALVEEQGASPVPGLERRGATRLVQGDLDGALDDARRVVEAGGDARSIAQAAGRIAGLDADLARGFGDLLGR